MVALAKSDTMKQEFSQYGYICLYFEQQITEVQKNFEDEWLEKCVLRNALGKYEDLGYSPEELNEIIKETKGGE